MYSDSMRRTALGKLGRGKTFSAVSRETGISRAALRGWVDQENSGAPRRPRATCPACNREAKFPPGRAYAALLGYYLGDGCISRMPRYFMLRISCDARLEGVIQDVERVIHLVHPERPIHRVPAPGTIVVQQNWQHWPCLFPQHGPGRKHERPIELDGWQRRVIEASPSDFLRGLFHSDGCRSNNWTTQRVAGASKRYDYPRWQFTNHSADIRQLCCWALDLADVPWRQSNWKTVSVSTRAGVARLDALIGLKT